MTSDERDRRDAVRATWVDATRVAIAPTLDDDERERRAMRERAVAYADARKERGHSLRRGGAHPQPLISRHAATSKARSAHHHLREGGVV
jgi:hypothetical protein